MALAPRAESDLDLNTPELQHRVHALRALDNTTNWLYLLREYLLLGLTLGSAVAFYQAAPALGLAWAWYAPVTLAAWVLVGALQHRLATLGHEAVHYTLFRNRLLNELASDWLCMFPLLSNTQYYRPQHLGHHQFVNDPDRDPDLTQLAASGHRFDFPLRRGRFLWDCLVKQLLWPVRLVRYILVRARYAALGDASVPYETPSRHARWVSLAEILYLVSLAGLLTGAVRWGRADLLILVSAAYLSAATLAYAFLPESFLRTSLIRPAVPPRWMALSRLTYLTLLFTALAGLSHATGRPWGAYYAVLWVVPLGTTFALFMILRQVVQHENADRGRLTNTRVFRVGRFLRFAVFPLGMDYHLPHHLFPLVPHYRLRELHELLLSCPAYRDRAVVTDGYFLPGGRPPRGPTVLDLLAGHAPGLAAPGGLAANNSRTSARSAATSPDRAVSPLPTR